MKKIVTEKKRQVIENIEHTHKGILERKGGKNIKEDCRISNFRYT